MKQPVLTVALCLAAALWLHDLDHVRQGRSIDGPVVAIGFIAYTAIWLVVALALINARPQYVAAIVVGAGIAVGLLAVHTIPDWGRFSDGFPTARVDAVSWLILVLAEIVAVWLAIVGARGEQT
jgi:hypothetical protein